MNYLHGEDIKQKWAALSLEAQLGNIGSEYERALRWKTKNHPEMFQNAAERMLELFDLTISDGRWHGHRLRELCRTREAACSELFNGQEIKSDPESLKKYFLQFAIAAKNKV